MNGRYSIKNTVYKVLNWGFETLIGFSETMNELFPQPKENILFPYEKDITTTLRGKLK